ncbi:MAG TPA: HD domain-containing protein [Myxococcota bacterium]|nr:HD domain-containing protein [Myxococcota bacterium]HQK51786.1 HD domain-containing protein [Myxococcota bacterium]
MAASQDTNPHEYPSIRSTFRLLVIGQPPAFQRVVQSFGPFGFVVEHLPSWKEAQELLRSRAFDVILVDGSLPGDESLAVLRGVRGHRVLQDLPIVMLLFRGQEDREIRAYQMGADDVVLPDTPDATIRARLRVLLRLSATRSRLANEKRRMELYIAERTRELREVTLATVAALERAAEMSDQETGHHMSRVAEYSALLAQSLGESPDFVERLRLYAPLHDIGKVGVPPEILKKEGVLTRVEFEEMQKHTIYGHEILSTARADPMAANIALSHHERFDGSGYPSALRGEAIPLEARIVALADVFDALTTRRHYKEAMHPEDAFSSIAEELKTRFAPRVLKAMGDQQQGMLEIFRRFQ